MDEILSTKVTKEDLANAWTDEYGVKYSPDGKRLLKANKGLREYKVREGTECICDEAFWCCESLTSITLPDSLTSIGDNAFCKSGINNIISHSSHFIVEIGALYNETKTELLYYFDKSRITISDFPNSLTSIGNCAFSGCKSLTSITLPNGLTNIGKEAFYDCSSLANITLPDGLTSIGESAFSGCESLTSITLPDSLTSIEKFAFEECKSLTSITLPERLTSIGKSVFVDSGINSIISHSSHFIVEEGGLYNKTKTELLYYFDKSRVTISDLPNSLTSIGDEAFSDCRSLESITLPDSLTSIGEDAFYECSSLVGITLPKGLTSIGRNAFCSYSSRNTSIYVSKEKVEEYKKMLGGYAKFVEVKE